MSSNIQVEVNRAIAFEKAADGFSDSILAPVMQDAAQQVRAAMIDQGMPSEAWEQLRQSALDESARVASAQSVSDESGGSRDSASQPQQVTEENVILLSRLYGAQLGWQQRMGAMPDLDAVNLDKLAAFVEVHRQIEDGDDILTQRAQAIYERLNDQGITPDPLALQVFQAQYEQFQSAQQPTAEAKAIALESESPLESDPNLTEADRLVSRVSEAALDWLYEIGSNCYEGSHNTFTWTPATRELVIEGEVSVHAVQAHDGQWDNLGSEVNEAFVTSLEVHVRRQQDLQKELKEGQSR
jgi:hypothetical protein